MIKFIVLTLFFLLKSVEVPVNQIDDKSILEIDTIQNKKCSIYITFHHKINNIYEYSCHGKYIRNVLILDNNTFQFSSFRAMKLLNDGSLIVSVVNSYNISNNHFIKNNRFKKSNHSMVILFSPKLSSKREYGNRIFKKIIASGYYNLNNVIETDEYMVHPYDMAMDVLENHIYVTSQNTNAITKYSINTNNNNPTKHLFYQWKFEKINESRIGIRGLIIDPLTGLLYIAVKRFSGIFIFNTSVSTTDLFPIKFYHFNRPIGLFFNNVSRNLYIGCAGQNPYIAEILIDCLYNNNFCKIEKYMLPREHKHPAGISVYGNTLYVLSQISKSIITFNTLTKLYKGQLIQNLPDIPEHLLIF